MKKKRLIPAGLILILIAGGFWLFKTLQPKEADINFLGGEISNPANNIVLLTTGTVDDYNYKLFRHTTHTCAQSGYQTFLLVYPKIDDLKSKAPLMVRLHGGGAGLFKENGEYSGSGWITQENEDKLLPFFQERGLTASLRTAIPKMRFLITSMCDHDYRLGNGTVEDPNNPNNPDENGNPRTADGLISDLKALLYITKIAPTNKFFIHGTSAGAYGAFGLSAQLSQKNPTNARFAGVILDSAVADWDAWKIIAESKESCGAIQEFVRPRLGRFGHDNHSEPALFSNLASQGKWRAPVYLTYSTNDIYGCGHKQITYTNNEGQTVTERGTDILYRNMVNVIEEYNPGGLSKVAAMCVGANCDRHVPTEINLSDSLQATGNTDYNSQLTQWVLNLP